MPLPTAYHEDPSLWRKVHNLWVSEIYHALKPQVVGRLSLAIDQEVTLIAEARPAWKPRPDLHASEGHGGASTKPEIPSRVTVDRSTPERGAASAYAEGIESWDSESRHFLVLRDLTGARVIGVLEILSPTNKGLYSRLDRESFAERRTRFLSTDAAYLEVDALSANGRWLPRSLSELADFAGVAWTSCVLAESSERHFRGWAWNSGEPLPTIPWALGEFGEVTIDLDSTIHEAMRAGGNAEAR